MENPMLIVGVGCGGNEFEVRIEVNAKEVTQIDKNTVVINGAILTFDEEVELC